MRKAIITLVLLLSFETLGTCLPESTLFFGNGMFNSKESAHKSLEVLKKRLFDTENWKKHRSLVAYNYDEAAVFQLFEVLGQKQGDFDKRFWKWLTNWVDAPIWFQHMIKQMQARTDLAGLQGYSLSEQVMKYEEELGAEKSIVVVAHSQGNFFANSASLVLQAGFYPASRLFKIISVATPASFVQDDGPYFTLKSDGVVRFIPGSLPVNSENQTPVPGFLDHQFVSHYLNGTPTGEKIVQATQAAFQDLLSNSKKNGEFNSECWDWFKSLKLDKSDRKDCTLRCNSAKNSLGNVMCNALCETYCSCRN